MTDIELREGGTISLDLVREYRTKAYKFRGCDEPEEHDFRRVIANGEPVLILCTKCGRTPLEMLSEMKIVNDWTNPVREP